MPSPNWGDVPTWGLLVGASLTAVYAMRAFGKQSEELKTLKQQADDGRTLIEQQADLIRIQTDQLADQRRITDQQVGVLELQAKELVASLEGRRLQRRDQAIHVMVYAERGPDLRGSQVQDVSGFPRGDVVRIVVRNKSDLAIREVWARWHLGSAEEDQVELAEILGAHEETSDTKPIPVGAVHEEFGAVVHFRDAFGQHWRAYPGGKLEAIARDWSSARAADRGPASDGSPPGQS